jgi:thiol:disulfide interchange protein
MADAPEQGETRPQERRGLPTWAILLGLLLLGGMIVLNQYLTTRGPKVDWAFHDLEAARAAAQAQNRRIFLYLCTPGEAAADRNDREVFTKPWAREILATAVCCRIELSSNDPRRADFEERFGYRGQPMMMVLDAAGQRPVVNPVVGAPDENEFYTYITEPLRRSAPAAAAPDPR